MTAAKCSERAFHVDRGPDRWDIVDSEGRIIGHRHNQGEAIDFAIQKAQHAHAHGEDVVVCIEQEDGHYTLAWSSG